MSKAVMEQALDALERYSPLPVDHEWYTKHRAAIKALKVELAKPEPEPVAWMHPTSHNCISAHRHVYANGIPLYRGVSQAEYESMTPKQKAFMGAFS